jgi:hypothetical protein
MRKLINLPDDVPPELLKPAREDDNDDIKLARWQALLSLFPGRSVETPEEATKLIFELAAVPFPAFRAPKKGPGRPRGLLASTTIYSVCCCRTFGIQLKMTTKLSSLMVSLENFVPKLRGLQINCEKMECI